MREDGGFTSAVRLELASLPVPSEREARAELAGMLLVAGGGRGELGTEQRRRVEGFAGLRPGDLPLAPLGDGETLRLDVPSSAVARRGLALVQRALGLRPRLTAVSTSGGRAHGPAYRVSLPVAAVREREAGRGPRPAGSVPRVGDDGDAETSALLRGVLLVGGSISAPDRPVHVEFVGVPDAVAPLLIAAITQLIPGAGPRHDATRRRLVLKSGDAVADLLAAVGATRAFLTFDDRRLRRQLRGEANRLANADAANLARIAHRAGAQVDVIEGAVEREGWGIFDLDLRDAALARLANPSASVTELGELLGVPRTTLHRRLRRAEEVARQVVEGPSAGVGANARDSFASERSHPRERPQEDA